MTNSIFDTPGEIGCVRHQTRSIDDLDCRFRGHNYLSRRIGGTRLEDLFEDVINGILVVPIRVVTLEFLNVANVPNVVTDTVVLKVGEIELVSRERLTDSNRLQHGAVRMATPTHVVNFSHAGIFVEVYECRNQIMGVNIVPDLLSLVSEDPVGPSFHDALHEISQETMELGSGMGGTGETTAAEHAGLHPKIPAIFLHQNIGGHLAGPKQGVLALINRHRLVDPDVKGV